MLQRLTDRIRYLSMEAERIHNQKKVLDKNLANILKEWSKCENKIVEEEARLSAATGGSQVGSQANSPGEIEPESEPNERPQDEGQLGASSDTLPETPS